MVYHGGYAQWAQQLAVHLSQTAMSPDGEAIMRLPALLEQPPPPVLRQAYKCAVGLRLWARRECQAKNTSYEVRQFVT